MSGRIAATFAIPLALLAAVLIVPQRVLAQVRNGITEPAPGDVISGIVLVKGTAEHPDFLRYEISFQPAFSPGSDWIVFAQGEQPVLDDTLAVWDTTVGGVSAPVFPDGRYQLRLRVVRNDYNYDEFYVTDIVIANSNLTPTATATITPTIGPAVETPSSSTAIAATVQAESGILPTLTPFPTPTQLTLSVDEQLGPSELESLGDGEEGRGILGQLAGIDTGRFGRAFWFGVTLVAYAFVGLAIYLLLRAFLRWIRRWVRAGRGRWNR